MNMFYPWIPPVSPETAWLNRVLLDLSDLFDAGAIDSEYFRRASTFLHLVALIQEPDIPDEVKVRISTHLINRQGQSDADMNAVSFSEDDFQRSTTTSADDFSERIDEDGTVHLLPEFAIAGRRWDFKKTDADSNRPAPHGHDQEDHSIVLDPYSGAVTNGSGRGLKTASPKEIDKLWRNRQFRKFAFDARDWMKTSQPWRRDALPDLPPAASQTFTS